MTAQASGSQFGGPAGFDPCSLVGGRPDRYAWGELPIAVTPYCPTGWMVFTDPDTEDIVGLAMIR